MATLFTVELTLNRFGFYRPYADTIQFGCLRFSWCKSVFKGGITFEINWKLSCEKEHEKKFSGRHVMPDPILTDPVLKNFLEPPVCTSDGVVTLGNLDRLRKMVRTKLAEPGPRASVPTPAPRYDDIFAGKEEPEEK